MNNEQLVARYQMGNEEALVTLINTNLPICKYFIHNWRKDPNYDDLLQVGSIAIIKASRGYRFDLGILFKTYVCRIIRNHISNWIKQHKRHIRKFSSDTALDPIFNPPMSLEDQEIVDKLYKCIEFLKPIQKRTILESLKGKVDQK